MSGSMFHYINLVKQSTDGTDSLSPKQSRPTTTLSANKNNASNPISKSTTVA